MNIKKLFEDDILNQIKRKIVPMPSISATTIRHTISGLTEDEIQEAVKTYRQVWARFFPLDIDYKFHCRLNEMGTMFKLGTLQFTPAMVVERTDPYAYKEMFYDYVKESIKEGNLVFDSGLNCYIWRP